MRKLNYKIFYRIDSTLTGHILGRAEVRGQGPIPERTMSPVYTAAVRLILHMSLFLGAGENLQVFIYIFIVWFAL